MTDEEIAIAVKEAHARGKRVAAHARSRESVKQCVRHGIEIIYHASFADEEALDMLEAAKDRHFVAPGIAWLINTSYHAAEWGITPEAAQPDGLPPRARDRLRDAEEDAPARHPHPARRRLRLRLDARTAPTRSDLEYFVKYLGFTPMEALLAATKLRRPDHDARAASSGQVKEGYLADLGWSTAIRSRTSRCSRTARGCSAS